MPWVGLYLYCYSNLPARCVHFAEKMTREYLLNLTVWEYYYSWSENTITLYENTITLHVSENTITLLENTNTRNRLRRFEITINPQPQAKVIDLHDLTGAKSTPGHFRGFFPMWQLLIGSFWPIIQPLQDNIDARYKRSVAYDRMSGRLENGGVWIYATRLIQCTILAWNNTHVLN